ncbi:hypothetical protein [Brevibacterium album]|uniref:hypothetical protein n=1 Tax=Brevibacterium album TaxID=417948 RepID=UPI00316AC871
MRSSAARLEVIAGPMFAGKSEELLRRVRRLRIAGVTVEVVTHVLDVREGPGAVATHAGSRAESRQLEHAADIVRLASSAHRPDVIAIDEAQFFGVELIPTVEEAVRSGITVIASGLCVTFDGEPFEPLPALMATAESVSKLTAVCAECGEEAAFHQRIPLSAETDPNPADALRLDGTHVGGAERYEARCRAHFAPDAPAQAKHAAPRRTPEHKVQEAMARRPRHDFLPEGARARAGEDAPIAIGHGQTNSQPSTVAAMLALLDVHPGQQILDVGSGSGWTTALLGDLVGSSGAVTGLERIPEILAASRSALAAHRMGWVTVQQADPSVPGAPDIGPFDRILVSAEAAEVPRALVDQLRLGGVMVIPVRGTMLRVQRTDSDGGTSVTEHGGYRFVPLVLGE